MTTILQESCPYATPALISLWQKCHFYSRTRQLIHRCSRAEEEKILHQRCATFTPHEPAVFKKGPIFFYSGSPCGHPTTTTSRRRRFQLLEKGVGIWHSPKLMNERLSSHQRYELQKYNESENTLVITSQWHFHKNQEIPAPLYLLKGSFRISIQLLGKLIKCTVPTLGVPLLRKRIEIPFWFFHETFATESLL